MTGGKANRQKTGMLVDAYKQAERERDDAKSDAIAAMVSMERVAFERDELVEALKWVRDNESHLECSELKPCDCKTCVYVRAALAKVGK